MFKLSSILSSRNATATGIAIIFHVVGLVGILVFKSDLIIRSTPINLLLSFGLLIWTQPEKNSWFYTFLILTAIVGFGVEVIGVNTGYLFGDYSYGTVLGFKWIQVPLMIGINWFITIYCCGVAMHTLLNRAIQKVGATNKQPSRTLKIISLVTDSATLAVAFDWLMEPVAVQLGFWKWLGDGSIPLLNYICWYFISAVLLLFFHTAPFAKKNNFAVNLLLIQLMFFLLLRTFLNSPS